VGGQILKPCLGDASTGRACGVLSPYNRCDTHRRARERYRGSSTARGYDGAWRRLQARVVREWVAVHGWVCPGYMRPGHPSHHLTGDHIVPLSVDPSLRLERSNVGVLCAACNSAKRDRPATLDGGRGGDTSGRGFSGVPRPWSRLSREKAFEEKPALVFVR
jgi:hypothetical protein